MAGHYSRALYFRADKRISALILAHGGGDTETPRSAIHERIGKIFLSGERARFISLIKRKKHIAIYFRENENGRFIIQVPSIRLKFLHWRFITASENRLSSDIIERKRKDFKRRLLFTQTLQIVRH